MPKEFKRLLSEEPEFIRPGRDAAYWTARFAKASRTFACPFDDAHSCGQPLHTVVSSPI
jgi:hypothetical protein